ncbi:MAG: L,D-transpeptidase family protein [Muribaculaceae bacterium]|nr:L,D-transpeptidase family protein [Muribaculaceae bacterium]
MKFTYIFVLFILLMASCGGRKSVSSDSLDTLSETDSILIDESTRIDTGEDSLAVVDKDTIKVKEIKFSSASELKEYLKKSSHSAEYSQGIIPLIADKSLDYAQKLVNNPHEGFIIVDKSRMKVVLLDKYGREKLSYGMACAKNYGTKHKKADSRTPEGFFSAQGIYNSTDWLFTNDNGYTSPARGQFGPRFIRLKCPNTSQIGIHGTAAPGSIGRRASHGCIRVTNENILELVKHVKVGMPIIVVPGRKDIEVNNAEGVASVWIPSSFDAVEPKPGVPDPIESNAAKTEKKQEKQAQTNNNATDSAAANKAVEKSDSTSTPSSMKSDIPEEIKEIKKEEPSDPASSPAQTPSSDPVPSNAE